MIQNKFYTNVAIVGSNVLVREVIDGVASKRKDPWLPTIYTKGNVDPGGHKFVSMYGEPVYPLQPGSIPDTKEYIEQYKEVSNFEIFGQLNLTFQYMYEYKPTGWDFKYISAWSIDIETKVPEDENGKTFFPIPDTCAGEVLLITMVDMHSGNKFTFGTKPYNGTDTNYLNCDNEYQLLKQFVSFWEQKAVDVITGWNIDQFDIPYLINRINAICGEEVSKRLSPWGRVYCKSKMFKKRLEYVSTILGVSILDYMDLYMKYMPVRLESYSLGHVASVELGHTKVDHSEFKSFNDFWRLAWDKFTHYNIVDANLIRELEDKLRLIRVVLTMAYKANINYEDVSSPVKLWDAIICNECMDQNIVVPQQANERQGEHLDGAYVKEPVPGWYKNVSSVDATSLYPSNIITNNISPETYVGNCGLGIDDFLDDKVVDVEEQYVVTPAGAVYSKEKRGIFPEIVIKYMEMRKESKTEMLRLEQEYENTKDASLKDKIAALDNLQYAIKIAMNSLYGATANKWFRFFKHDHAASITLSGQYILRTIEYNIDRELNALFKTEGVKYLIYIDTDSLYFDLDPIVKKCKVPDDKAIRFIEKLMKEKVNPVINSLVAQCCAKMRSFDNRIIFKLEVAADKALWVGKKKYALRVHSSEGVTFAKPKMKVKGLEMVKSSTPKYVRDQLKKALDLIFETNEKEVQKFVEKVRGEFMQLKYNEVSFPRGANNLEEFEDPVTIYKRGAGNMGCPIQVRGVLLYNHFLQHHFLDGKYPLIGDGDKIRFTYLKMPNRMRENVISFPVDGVIPEEFGIIDRVDYEMQFEKTFLASVEILLKAIGWQSVETSSLDEFFA
jgi:DNA polymerase elongation subunit (family B)